MIAHRCLDPRLAAGSGEGLQCRKLMSVEGSEDQLIHRGMPDDAGVCDDARYVCRAAGHMRAADGAGEHVDAIDAVLERNDKRVWSDKRREHSDRALAVVELDREG